MAPNKNIKKGTETVLENGKTYRWLGAQWVEIKESGKQGKIASKEIVEKINIQMQRGVITEVVKNLGSSMKKSVSDGLAKLGESKFGNSITNHLEKTAESRQQLALGLKEAAEGMDNITSKIPVIGQLYTQVKGLTQGIFSFVKGIGGAIGWMGKMGGSFVNLISSSLFGKNLFTMKSNKDADVPTKEPKERKDADSFDISHLNSKIESIEKELKEYIGLRKESLSKEEKARKQSLENEKLRVIKEREALEEKATSDSKNVILSEVSEKEKESKNLIGGAFDRIKDVFFGTLGGSSIGTIIGSAGKNFISALGSFLGSMGKLLFNPVTGLIAGSVWAIFDGMKGMTEFGGVSGFIGGLFGGLDKGIKGMFSGAGKWALIGMGVGSIIPGFGTLIGGVIGALFGGIAGFIGGERISNFLKQIDIMIFDFFDTIASGVKNMFQSITDTWNGRSKLLGGSGLGAEGESKKREQEKAQELNAVVDKAKAQPVDAKDIQRFRLAHPELAKFTNAEIKNLIQEQRGKAAYEKAGGVDIPTEEKREGFFQRLFFHKEKPTTSYVGIESSFAGVDQTGTKATTAVAQGQKSVNDGKVLGTRPGISTNTNLVNASRTNITNSNMALVTPRKAYADDIDRDRLRIANGDLLYSSF